ncbi:Magnesium transporter [Desulfonema limicola]|uniref:Magnesium transporter MgtE n=1 Tax=Desulfonema limicola TaxID=45656 RepID=A0A975GI81_9BACT|nr:magnesium transporter [Desulfonema limicola]QTA82257.1 Magnesium transporter [Desulfonema limicola]
MNQDRHKILTESIKRLLRRNAIPHLSKIMNKTHAADLSRIFQSLSLSHQHKLFDLIKDIEKKGILFSEMDEDTFLYFIADMKIEDIVAILEYMPSDDVADIIERLPEDKADLILKTMKKKESEEVEDLLRYGDDTAGRIMVPDFIALREDHTAQQAIESLQKEYVDVEMPFYLYVVDEYGKLTGVSSLRQLVVVSPDTPLKEFMSTAVFSVRTDTDQEEVAKLVARYDILAVPVVDHMNKLVGIVTVDDVIDIIREEATEDILKMVGAGQEFVETKSVFKSTKIRFPWLFASCLGGIIAFFIIGHFEKSLSKVTYLAAFIPVIMGMGGNIGTQSSTIVVRGLSTGLLHVRDIWSVVFKELSIGMLLGLIYGSLIGIVAQLQYNLPAFAVSVSIAVITSMSVAALVGSMVPMIFGRLNIDPAVASGPFVTTFIDIIAVFCYFQIATLLLEL